MRLSHLFAASTLLALTTWSLAQTGLGGTQWTNDLSLERITLDYPGANASATAKAYALPPNADVTVLVTVHNRSSNPALPFRIDLTAGGQSIGSIPGSSVPSQGEKQFSLKWSPRQGGQGQGQVMATLVVNSPSANKQPCSNCRNSKVSSQQRYPGQAAPPRCNFPYSSCNLGDMGSVCSCHPTVDDPTNNSVSAAYQMDGPGGVKPTSPSGSADGIDLVVDSAYVKPSVAKMGTYEAYVRVGNQGTRPCPGSFDVEVSVGSMKRMVTFRGGLRPNESKTEIVEFTKDGPCHVLIDPRNAIPEAKKDNNSL